MAETPRKPPIAPPGDEAARYTIGDLAREFDITPRTIRFYESEGLLSPGRNGQTRVYSQGDRVRLRLILRGRRLGFSVSEIGEMLDLYKAPDGPFHQIQHVINKIRERRQALLEQRKDIQVILSELEAVEQRCLDELLVKEAL